MSIILSFDVGVVHLAYCLLTKKEEKWEIIEWNNIDLTNRENQKCHCGNKASLFNTINSELKYYCKVHGKKLNIIQDPIEEYFNNAIGSCTTEGSRTPNFVESCTDKCQHEIKSSHKICNKKAVYSKNNINFCNIHAKQNYKLYCNDIKIKPFKLQNSSNINFDEIKYKLIKELDNHKHLLSADSVVIENQPSLKNPRMKSIASTLYDYYLIRGIIDKDINKSNIKEVKFISPSNKLKIDGISNEKKSYKEIKDLGIKYCSNIIQHLPTWLEFFNSNKKKDDLADSFLQGIYYYNTLL
jgi:hypothetical protein